MPALKPPWMSEVRESPMISIRLLSFSESRAKQASKNSFWGFCQPMASEMKRSVMKRSMPDRRSRFLWVRSTPLVTT